MSRSSVKRCKERCLEEAAQLLRRIPDAQLRGSEDKRLLLLVKLLLSTQLQTVSISTACRKVDQVSPASCTLPQNKNDKIYLKLLICLTDVAAFIKCGP